MNASPKSNIRSFRYSDEVAAMLEKQKGDSLNQKFENLVVRCSWELPAVEKKIAAREKDLDALNQRINEARDKLYEFERLISEKNRVSKAITDLAMLVIGYNEKIKETM